MSVFGVEWSLTGGVCGQLLGQIDMDTREWSDGVLTYAARQVVKEPLGTSRSHVIQLIDSAEDTLNCYSVFCSTILLRQHINT